MSNKICNVTFYHVKLFSIHLQYHFSLVISLKTFQQHAILMIYPNLNDTWPQEFVHFLSFLTSGVLSRRENHGTPGTADRARGGQRLLVFSGIQLHASATWWRIRNSYRKYPAARCYYTPQASELYKTSSSAFKFNVFFFNGLVQSHGKTRCHTRWYASGTRSAGTTCQDRPKSSEVTDLASRMTLND